MVGGGVSNYWRIGGKRERQAARSDKRRNNGSAWRNDSMACLFIGSDRGEHYFYLHALSMTNIVVAWQCGGVNGVVRGGVVAAASAGGGDSS